VDGCPSDVVAVGREAELVQAGDAAGGDDGGAVRGWGGGGGGGDWDGDAKRQGEAEGIVWALRTCDAVGCGVDDERWSREEEGLRAGRDLQPLRGDL
jgi:hypothetical protein